MGVCGSSNNNSNKNQRQGGNNNTNKGNAQNNNANNNKANTNTNSNNNAKNEIKVESKTEIKTEIKKENKPEVKKDGEKEEKKVNIKPELEKKTNEDDGVSQSLVDKIIKESVVHFNNYTKKGTKFINFTNAFVKELNYSALKVQKFWKDQSPYSGTEPYVDSVFPPDDRSIFGLDSEWNPIDKNEERRREAEEYFNIDKDDIVWLRPKEIFGDAFAVFEGDIEFDDVRQGSIGNCYFMASISALTENPQIIAEIFRMHDIQENGYYEICLKIDGVWNVVILDDKIPCSKKTRKPIFANPKGHELWAILLEKAWAKVNGGYINTVSGIASEVIECLTNFPYEYNIIKNLETEEDKEELWKKVIEASLNDYIMTTALPAVEGAKEVGLVEGHEYTLQEGKEKIIDGEKIRLVKIRNPWGSINYKGAWSQHDSRWTEEAKLEFDYKNTYDGEGECFIQWDDFLYYFSDIDICKIENRICMKQSQIHFSESNIPHLYEISLLKPSEMTITIFKPYYRFIRELPTDWTLTQQLLFAKCVNKETLEFTDFEGIAEGQNDCTLNLKLEPGTYYLYANINYESARDTNGYPIEKSILENLSNNISVYSTEFFNFNEIQEERMALFHRMALSYCRGLDIPEDKKIKVHSESNFCKSEFYFVYLESSGLTKPVNFTFNFNNIQIQPITNENTSITFTIYPKQENVIAFSCLNMYEGHGMGFSYGYNSRNIASETELLPSMEALPTFPNDLKSISKYSWIYKKGDVDYKNILKKIDVSEAAFNFFKYQYPKLVEELEKVPKLENHEELKLEVQDKYDLGDGDWYFGEWRNLNNELNMWGRGYAYLSGNYFIGQFVAHSFTGIGKMILPRGDIISGEFKNFNPVGKCQYTFNDGKVETRVYAAN